jgi:hypothetical protein
MQNLQNPIFFSLLNIQCDFIVYLLYGRQGRKMFTIKINKFYFMRLLFFFSIFKKTRTNRIERKEKLNEKNSSLYFTININNLM